MVRTRSIRMTTSPVSSPSSSSSELVNGSHTRTSRRRATSSSISTEPTSTSAGKIVKKARRTSSNGQDRINETGKSEETLGQTSESLPSQSSPSHVPPTLKETVSADPRRLASSEEMESSDLVHMEIFDQPMEPTAASVSVTAGDHSRTTADGSLCLYTSARESRESAVQTISVETKPNIVLLPEDLKIKLECPVCSRISLPPIKQCRNGHVTCYNCRLKVQSCPVCRECDIDIRNMFAEKAITYMVIPCEFEQFGCRLEIQYREKEDHEKLCKYRPYICPYIECDHKLAADTVVEHVSTAHREECRRSDGPEITASMILIGLYFGGDGAWSPRLITCFGKTFFDVALTRDRWLHHWVWLLGEEDEAQQYLYEITAFKGNTKYIYGGEVSSLRTSDDEIVSNGLCLSISDAIGRRLRDGDKIRYKLKLVKKTEQTAASSR